MSVIQAPEEQFAQAHQVIRHPGGHQFLQDDFSLAVRHVPQCGVQPLFTDGRIQFSHTGMAEEIIQDEAEFAVAFPDLILCPLRFPRNERAHPLAFIVSRGKSGKRLYFQ